MPDFCFPRYLADFAITAHGFNGNPPQPLPRQISTHLSDLDGRLDVPQVTIPGDGADDHRHGVRYCHDHIIPAEHIHQFPFQPDDEVTRFIHR